MPHVGDRITLRTNDGAIRVFELTRHVGHGRDGVIGGMGHVLSGRELSATPDMAIMDQPIVALKFVNRAEEQQFFNAPVAETQGASPFRDALRREGEILDLVRRRYPNPRDINIVRLVCHGEIFQPEDLAGDPVLVMEFCPITLQHILKNRGMSEETEAAHRRLATVPGFAKLARDVAVALDALTRLPGDGRAYTHRDIKPSNLLWSGTSPLLADFGTVKLQRHETCSLWAFTDLYAAPEVRHEFQRRYGALETDVVKPLAINYRSADIYSLGTVLFEVLTKRKLKIQRQTNAVPEPNRRTGMESAEREDLCAAVDGLADTLEAGAGVPGDERWNAVDIARLRSVLPDLIERCLSIAPAARPTAANLIALLDGTAAEAPAAGEGTLFIPGHVHPVPSAPPAPAVSRRPAAVRRRPWRVAWTAVAALLCLAGLTVAASTPLRLSITAPQLGMEEAPARRGSAPGASVRPLCQRKDGVASIPIGEKLVFKARFDVGWRGGRVHPLLATIPEFGSIRFFDPAAGSCERTPTASGELWSCVVPVDGRGLVDLLVLGRLDEPWDIAGLSAVVSERFPSSRSRPGPGLVGGFLAGQATTSYSTTIAIDLPTPDCR